MARRSNDQGSVTRGSQGTGGSLAAGDRPPTSILADFEAVLRWLLQTIWNVARTLATRLGFGDLDDDVATKVQSRFEKQFRTAHEEGNDTKLDRMLEARHLAPWVSDDVRLAGLELRRKQSAELRRNGRHLQLRLLDGNPFTSPDLAVELEEFERIKRETLDSMTSAHRAVYALKTEDDLTLREISERLQMPVITVRRRLAEVVQRLTEALEDFKNWPRVSEVGIEGIAEGIAR